jgi:hypothetical protein
MVHYGRIVRFVGRNRLARIGDDERELRLHFDLSRDVIGAIPALGDRVAYEDGIDELEGLPRATNVRKLAEGK